MHNQPKFGFLLEYVPDVEAAKSFYKIFGIKDPAGQTLFLLEFSQNRPSRASPGIV